MRSRANWEWRITGSALRGMAMAALLGVAFPVLLPHSAAAEGLPPTPITQNQSDVSAVPAFTALLARTKAVSPSMNSVYSIGAPCDFAVQPNSFV